MLSAIPSIIIAFFGVGISDTVFGTSIVIGSRTHIEWRRNDTLISTQVLDGDTTIRRDGDLPADGIRVAMFRGERHAIPYCNNRPEGIAVSVDDVGGVTFETYVQGAKEGLCGTLLSNGDTLYRAEWRNGMVDGSFAGWIDGHLLDEGEMFEGSGISRRHRTDGSVSYIETWSRMHKVRVVDLYPSADTSAITDYDSDTIVSEYAFGCRGLDGFLWNQPIDSSVKYQNVFKDTLCCKLDSVDTGTIRISCLKYPFIGKAVPSEFIYLDSILKQIVLRVPDSMRDTVVSHFTTLFGAPVFDRQDTAGIWLESIGEGDVLFANGTISIIHDSEASSIIIRLCSGDSAGKLRRGKAE